MLSLDGSGPSAFRLGAVALPLNFFDPLALFLLAQLLGSAKPSTPFNKHWQSMRAANRSQLSSSKRRASWIVSDRRHCRRSWMKLNQQKGSIAGLFCKPWSTTRVAQSSGGVGRAIYGWTCHWGGTEGGRSGAFRKCSMHIADPGEVGPSSQGTTDRGCVYSD